MKILDLVLKKEWFDMIKDGDKREEYREIKPYWLSRLFENKLKKDESQMYCENIDKLIDDINSEKLKLKDFTHIKFRRGYTDEHVIFRLTDISIGKGKKEWGATDNDVFVLKLAEKNITEEFNIVLNNVIYTKVNDYYIDGHVNIDKLIELFSNDIINIFHDGDLKFKSNNDLGNFYLYGADEHTIDVMKSLMT